MDEFAPLIVIFAVIGIVDKILKASNKNKKSKGNTQKPIQRVPSPETAPARSTAQSVRVKAVPTVQASAPVIRAAAPTVNAAAPRLTMEALETPDIQKAAVQMNVPDLLHAAPEAASPADAEGCIGGSIEHVQHEGESRAEHAAHLEAARLPAADAPRAQSLRGLNVSDLRRAVVMSEILDRPKALRR